MLKNRSTKIPLIALTAILICLGLFARFYRLGQIPLGLYWDEVSIAVEANSIAESGRDIHGSHWFQPIFPAYGDFKLPVYIWVSALNVSLFENIDLAVRLPSVLAGIGTIIISCLIAFRLIQTGRSNSKAKNTAILTALAAGLIVLISPWSIQFSRTAFEAHLAQFILGIAVWLALSRNPFWSLFISQLVAALAVYTYFSVRFVWPAVFLSIFILQLWQNIFSDLQIRFDSKFLIYVSNVSLLIFSLVLFASLLQPLQASGNFGAMEQLRYSTDSVLNTTDYALESNILRETAGNDFLSRGFYHRHWLLVRELLGNYADHLSFNFMFISGDANLRHGTGVHGLYLLPFLPIFLAGLYWLAAKYPKALLILGVWWLTSLLPASVPTTTPHALRSLNALIPLSIIAGAGVTALINWVGKLKISNRAKNLTVLAAGLVVLFFSTQYLHFYLVNYPGISAADWQYGFKQTALEICQQQHQVDKVKVDVRDDRFFLWFLAYCQPDQEKLSAADFDNYRLTRYHNIFFDKIDWQGLTKAEGRILTVIADDIAQVPDKEAQLQADFVKKLEFEHKDYYFYQFK